jgi:pantoate--beta-alanine ligase
MGDVMEGKFRPGHFDGVVNVIYRLFDIIKPNRAYFGLKDFQQVAVVQFLTDSLNLPVEIVACPTHRESNGLAMSSRNKLLSEQGKLKAGVIYKALEFAKKSALEGMNVETIKDEIDRIFNDSSLTLEYFDIVDPGTLETLDEISGKAQACIAAFCEEVRLIDNLEIK